MKHFVLSVLVVVLTWNASARPPENNEKQNIDYRYKDTLTGQIKLCVYCLQRDYERNGVEKQCLDKYEQGILPSEMQEWNGKAIEFSPLCPTLQTYEYPRYVKNCTAAPDFPGVEVNCADKDGHKMTKFQVHDTCSVKCTEPRLSPKNPLTVCDPVTATWTPVSCQYHSCPPLATTVIKGENETSSCDINVPTPVNTSCNVTCPVGYDPPVRRVECQSNGEWRLVNRCTHRPPPDYPWITPVVVAVAIALVFAAICFGCIWKHRQRCASDDSVTTKDKEETDNSQEKDSLIGSSQSDVSVIKHRTNTASEKGLPDFDQAPDYSFVSGGKDEMGKLLAAADDSVTTKDKEETDNNQEKDSLIGSSQSDVSVIEHRTNTAAEKGLPDSDGSMSSQPPDYASGGEVEMVKLLAAADTSCIVEFYYKVDNQLPEERITDSAVCAAKGVLLTVLARCKNGHEITKFHYGPFFKNNEYRQFGHGISVIVADGDQGTYILGAQCAVSGRDMKSLTIKITDVTGNPDHTEPKHRCRGVNLESLDSVGTQVHPPIIATSEPSQTLKECPRSLSSNPNLAALAREVNETDYDQQSLGDTSQSVHRGVDSREASVILGTQETGGALGAVGGTEDNRKNSALPLPRHVSTQKNLDGPPDDCTLLLKELWNDRSLKESLDTLCLKLEPLTDRNPDKTIHGLIYCTLGYSHDKIKHITWARRENLHESPARVLLIMMMQAGKKASDLVRYFSKHENHHIEVLEILQSIPAHQNCPECRNYS